MLVTTRIVLGASVLALAGCATTLAPMDAPPPAAALVEVPPPVVVAPSPVATPAPAAKPEPRPQDLRYAARADGERMLAGIDTARIDSEMLRTRVPYATDEAPGTVVIDSADHHLYLVEPEGMATRYGVAIGKEGFGWTGTGTIARTARWPRWTPPAEMIARDPSLARWADGMPGGTDNPLGARALYIYFGEQDSGYRIHGTNAPSSIGRSASSGCFRMLNQDAIDLYDRIERGARVVVL